MLFRSLGIALAGRRENAATISRQRRGACQPGATPRERVRERVPPGKAGGFLRPCRAHRSIPKPRALPWAGVRRRFQRRNQNCANPNSRVLMVGHLFCGWPSNRSLLDLSAKGEPEQGRVERDDRSGHGPAENCGHPAVCELAHLAAVPCELNQRDDGKGQLEAQDHLAQD
jgi:hypothetical protein